MMYNTPAITFTARKQHPECSRACAETCEEYADWEHMPGEGHRPDVGEFGRSA